MQEASSLTEHQQALLRATLALRPRALLADIDGTLSAIAPSPEQATLLPGMGDLLAEAQRTFDVVAVVSGRAAADALRLVEVAGLTYIGSHGLERLEPINTPLHAPNSPPMRHVVYPPAEPYRERIAQALAAIGAALSARYPGVRLEDKGVTASLHVRQTPNPTAAAAAAFAAAEDIATPLGLRVTRGKLVVELRPPVAMNKGLAIADLLQERGAHSAIYLGDDTTDRDAFHTLRRLTAEGAPDGSAFRGVSIAVLSAEAPPELAQDADIALAAITQVPALLRWLVLAARER